MGEVIKAKDGMWLFNGNDFAKEVHIGKYDSPENWREVTDEFKQEWEREHDESEGQTDAAD